MNKYKNKNAYKLMRYRCSKCRKIEWIWNSGDQAIIEEVDCPECSCVSLPVIGLVTFQIPELTPLGIRWFVTESKELYTKRIKQQVADMEDNLFQDTTREIVKKSLIDAYTPDKVYLVDPLTLNFEEQVEILLNTD